MECELYTLACKYSQGFLYSAVFTRREEIQIEQTRNQELSCGGGEFMQALSALEDLQDSIAVQSPTFLFFIVNFEWPRGQTAFCSWLWGLVIEEGGYLEFICGLRSVQPRRAAQASYFGGFGLAS